MSANNPGKENQSKLAPLIAALLLIIGFLAGARFGPGLRLYSVDSIPQKNRPPSLITLNEALGFLSSKYVDPLNRDSLVDEAINHWVSHLDPYSSYIKPKDLSWMNQRLAGSYVGIGIEFTLVGDSMLVTSVLENSPAATSGILVGDFLLAAGTRTVEQTAWQSAGNLMDSIKGEEGSRVHIKIFRPLTGKYSLVNCVRKNLKMPSVEFFLDTPRSLGYIKIKEFSAGIDQEFMLAMDTLFSNKNGERDLILDLRGNPGGYLEKSTHLINQLMEESGKVMVSTVSKSGKETAYKTSGRPFFKPRKIAVLIDEQTASASEIVAGALQDHKRAVVIGRPSFGKGLVQGQFPLSNGGALKLTIAKFYTPSGKLIQKPYKMGDTSKISGGILPDITVPVQNMDTSAAWKKAMVQILPFISQNKMDPQVQTILSKWEDKKTSSLFPANHFLVNSFLKQHNLSEDYRTIVWRKLQTSYAKQSSGAEAAMRIAFETDPFLTAALVQLKK